MVAFLTAGPPGGDDGDARLRDGVAVGSRARMRSFADPDASVRAVPDRYSRPWRHGPPVAEVGPVFASTGLGARRMSQGSARAASGLPHAAGLVAMTAGFSLVAQSCEKDVTCQLQEEPSEDEKTTTKTMLIGFEPRRELTQAGRIC